MRITKDIVSEARKILSSWLMASEEMEVTDFHIREVANLL
jgi:hypothetical protein